MKYYKTNLKTTKSRSKNMRHIHSTGTSIERRLDLDLWCSTSAEYWKNYRKLPGSPDIVLPKYHIAIFCDGEFWHGYNWAKKKKHIKRNRKYWIHKIENNMKRDKRQTKQLRQMGWIVLRFWGHNIQEHPIYCIDIIKYYIRNFND